MEADLPLDRSLRVVAIHIESIVRTTASEPYFDTRVIQIGAFRFGADTEWVTAEPSFDMFVALPDATWTIPVTPLADLHAAQALSGRCAARA